MDILTCVIMSTVIIVIGTVMHFLYDICHENKVVAVFSAINESVWEHVKIGLTGFLVVSFVDYFMYGGMNNYWVAKAFSIGAYVILIPAVYYFVRACMEKESVIADIIEFCVVIFLSELVFMGILNGLNAQIWLFYAAFVVLFLVLGAYVMFTWVQPKWGIFMDRRNGGYGFDGHKKLHKRSSKKAERNIDKDETFRELISDDAAKKRIAAAKKKPTRSKSVPKMGRL